MSEHEYAGRATRAPCPRCTSLHVDLEEATCVINGMRKAGRWYTWVSLGCAGLLVASTIVAGYRIRAAREVHGPAQRMYNLLLEVAAQPAVADELRTRIKFVGSLYLHALEND